MECDNKSDSKKSFASLYSGNILSVAWKTICTFFPCHSSCCRLKLPSFFQSTILALQPKKKNKKEQGQRGRGGEATNYQSIFFDERNFPAKSDFTLYPKCLFSEIWHQCLLPSSHTRRKL